uniref:Uncharacterized protein n=1 Tax=Knipowitschia caucasica TaxID=637954 RepID=A0AAV2LTV6_KNICA
MLLAEPEEEMCEKQVARELAAVCGDHAFMDCPGHDGCRGILKCIIPNTVETQRTRRGQCSLLSAVASCVFLQFD